MLIYMLVCIHYVQLLLCLILMFTDYLNLYSLISTQLRKLFPNKVDEKGQPWKLPFLPGKLLCSKKNCDVLVKIDALLRDTCGMLNGYAS